MPPPPAPSPVLRSAMSASCELAETLGAYESFPGSPLSKGVMQPDMWGVTPSGMWDWASLRARVAVHGARNSLLLAPMPTASTAQILGNNESIEPFTSNIYTRRVLAGEVRSCGASAELRRGLKVEEWGGSRDRNTRVRVRGYVCGLPCAGSGYAAGDALALAVAPHPRITHPIPSRHPSHAVPDGQPPPVEGPH